MSIFALKIAAKLHKNPEISIIICSHNRASNLNEVLPHYAQLSSTIPHEIVVVLNACTDNSMEVVQHHQQLNPLIRFVKEDHIGASNARNRGYKEAAAEIVFYIDDDAYPKSSLLEDIQEVIANEEVVSFTGRTVYWRKNDPAWIKESYVEMPVLSDEQIVMHSKGHINGCACGFKKAILEEVGGFDTDLDMKGRKIGYGVEEYIRLEILQAGYPTIYSPNIQVWHQSHSKTVKDFLKSSYYKGYYFAKVQPRNKVKLALKTVKVLVTGLPVFIKNLIQFKPKNALVEFLSLPLNYLGQLAG